MTEADAHALAAELDSNRYWRVASVQEWREGKWVVILHHRTAEHMIRLYDSIEPEFMGVVLRNYGELFGRTG